MMKLRINPIVAEDLKKIKEFIAEDNEEMAVKTIQEIYARIENIQQFPYMGADLAKRVSFRTDYKYVICGNYVVLYKIGKEYVEIYRVVNRYQDITKIFLWCEELEYMEKGIQVLQEQGIDVFQLINDNNLGDSAAKVTQAIINL